MKRSSPRKGRPYAILAGIAAVTVVALPFLLTAPGCGRQGEGQRCSRDVSATPTDPTTGNDDCAEGLFCLVVDGATSNVCCPAGGSTNANCQASSKGPDGGIDATTGAGGASSTTSSTSATSTSSATSSSSASSSSASSSSASSSSSSSSGSGSSSSTGP